MTWQLIVLIRVIIAYTFIPILIKKITALPSRTRRLSWQFFFCAIFSIIFAYTIKDAPFILNKQWLIIAGIGIINSFAAYSYWRAVDISLSKTSLFTEADDIIAILLGYMFLNELKFLNNFLIIGIILNFIAASIIAFHYYKSTKNNDGHHPMALFGWISYYSVIWGIAVFAMRYFALGGVTFSAFLTSWYFGTFIGTLLILYLPRFIVKFNNSTKPNLADRLHLASKKEAGEKLTIKGIGALFILAFALWLSMGLQYKTSQLAPITIFLPIFLVSEMVLPLLLGLFVFKEIKQLTAAEKIAFILGIVGILIIGWSY